MTSSERFNERPDLEKKDASTVPAGQWSEALGRPLAFKPPGVREDGTRKRGWFAESAGLAASRGCCERPTRVTEEENQAARGVPLFRGRIEAKIRSHPVLPASCRCSGRTVSVTAAASCVKGQDFENFGGK